MPIAHLFLALLVIVIWGLNFIFVKFSLDELSPMQLCTIRFILASIPVIFFIKRPAAPWKLIISFGLFMFALQFTLLFMGMSMGMNPGLSSLLMQVQVFFSMFFAAIFLKEIPTGWQLLGALVSFSGIGLIALQLDSHISIFGFILIMCAAATWGAGNLITKKIGKVNMMSLVIWGSFIAAIPLSLLTMIFEGPKELVSNIQHMSLLGWGSMCFIVYASTWVGYGVWNWLVSRYSVATVVPFTLLVPVVGIIGSIIILDEPFEFWKLIAGFLIITGLGINLVSGRFLLRKELKASEISTR